MAQAIPFVLAGLTAATAYSQLKAGNRKPRG